MSEAGEIRVLLANDRLGYDDARFHGAGRLMVEWTRALLRRGVNVTPVILRQPGSLGAAVEAEGLPFVFLNRHPYDPGTLIDFIQVLRQRRIQVLHLQGFGSTFFGRMAARLLGLPVIVHVHADHRFEPKSYPPLVRACDHALADHTDHVLAISAAVARFATEQQGFAPELVEVMHNPVDLGRFRPATADSRRVTREALGLESDTPVAICVARFDPVKGVDVLIEAWAKVVSMHPRGTLLLAGDGPLHESLDEQARRLGVADAIRFLGYRSDVESLLHAADICVVPSRSEGLSLAAIEAMATGLPVVASQVGGIPEVVEDGRTGILVEAENPAALAGAITRVLGDTTLRTRLAASARGAAQAYDIEAYCTRLVSLYQRLASHPTSSASPPPRPLSGVP
jgi:glycosyltransferase involved in cell wall biosynthesis